ncbi:MAG: c-type cytochrome [Gemmatimonadales bacterium]|nr:c-type cytochrome [Gemmatimonadales bacterium]
MRIRPVGPLIVVLAIACGGGTPDPAPDTTTTVTAVTDTAIPDSDLGASIRRGRAILLATRDSLPSHVGNDLRCTSCHLNEGRQPNAMPWTAVYAQFPQYRSRGAQVIRLEDRINDCFERSLNGTALSFDDSAMRDIVAYMAFLARGVPVGATVPGQGVPRLDALEGDTVAGAAVYAVQCARCHGESGEGTTIAPPTWGPRSFNIGAGMSRIRTAAGFIKANMPFDTPGTLSDKDAQDVSAYVTSRSRPDFARKHEDWPRGDAPPDVAYPTRAAGGSAAPTH